MKKLAKIKLQNVVVLEDKEMKLIHGGYDESYSRDPNPKITACINKKEGDPCSWVNFSNQVMEGHCKAFAPNYIKHCSDFN